MLSQDPAMSPPGLMDPPPGPRDSPGLRGLPQDPDTSQYPQDSETPETQRHPPGPRDFPGSRDLWDPETPPTRTQGTPQDPKNSQDKVRASGARGHSYLSYPGSLETVIKPCIEKSS